MLKEQSLSQVEAELISNAIELLKELISIPSLSKEENFTAVAIQNYFHNEGVETNREKNNVWVTNKYFDIAKPTILLNSHHDTVNPNKGYTKNPFEPLVQKQKLFGLGSNDAGGALVSLAATFLHFYNREDLKYNLIYAATAEEEISGTNGIELILPRLGKIEFAIVGEPTQMQLAIAEKGLMVIDLIAKGKSGHAAREEGDNAIYKALKDIEWIKNYQFPKISKMLGPVKMSVTIISAGTQHNVVPDSCQFTLDVRTIDEYTNEEILQTISSNCSSEIVPRSFRLKPSSIASTHAIVVAGKKLGRKIYGSPTTSDQALMNFPSLKCGPGDSARSHTADEFIYINEIEEGIELYCKMLEEII